MDYRKVSEINWETLLQRKFTPSPEAWEDQVFYFLMLDRFSDGNEKGYLDNEGNLVREGKTPVFQAGDANNIPREKWEQNGRGWCGGNLEGLESKIGYLSRMGITAIWISPVFKQVSLQNTYHGYGVQNFLAVDENFGKPDSLKKVVEKAHSKGIFVVLDIILNHSGNVFTYDADRYLTFVNGVSFMDPRWDGKPYNVKGFNDSAGGYGLPFGGPEGSGWPDGAVWPQELQQTGTFTCKGRISNWDYFPEFKEGDFFDLKDIHQGNGEIDNYINSPALNVLTECYKYWIAYADIDGFRIDTVKHMDDGAVRYFTQAVHEFAQSIGKNNFYLIGEITGGRDRAFRTQEKTGLDAALGIDDIPDKMEYMVKGYRNPCDYFNLFRNSLQLNKKSHTWFRNKVVTLFDDHDQVRKGNWKARYCAHDEGWETILNVMALNATTLGIPCIYYGSEQYFNGSASSDRDGNDIFLRECMFGGPFGSFQSSGCHFFDESSYAYRELAKILKIRKEKLTLRRGRQYLREISGNGIDFGLPVMMGEKLASIVPWSRILDSQEILLAINTDLYNSQTAWVTIDNGLHKKGGRLTCIYSTKPEEIGREIEIFGRNGKSVNLTVQPAGFVIYE